MKYLKTIFAIMSVMALAVMLNACGAGNGAPPSSSEWGAFNTSNLPDTETGGTPYSSFAFDTDGNLLFVLGNAGTLRSMNRETGAVTTITTGLPTDALRGITANENYFFVGHNDGEIYQVVPSTGAVSLLVTIAGGHYINCMAIAPDTFGSYGGQLIAASDTGIYAVNLSTLAVVQIAALEVSSIVFGSDGTLYAANYASSRIVTVTAAGTVTDFVTSGLSGPDGITIDDANGYLYTINDSDSTIKRVEISSGTVTTIVSGLSLSSGWAPSAIIYDSVGNLLLYGSGSDLTINYYNL